ncbi:MAG TPA: DUF6089 family protein [Flavisolibacter sp.]|nr:DUF6089 family protein [Flavisolibacter sp.]
MQRVALFVFAFFVSISSYGQWQLGLFGGVANYQGDLVEKAYQSSKGVFGISAGYQLSRRINLRAGLSFAKVAGADSLNKKADFRLRNFSFQTPITEFSLIGEFHSFDLEQKRWSPYIFGGVAVYRFNPYSFDQAGNQVYLQPLGTEGQGLPGNPDNPYALTQFAIPFGGGIKFNITDRIRLGLEVGLRKLFTDYLDDVSGNYADATELLDFRGQRAVDISYREDEVPGGEPAYPLKGEQRGSPKYKDYYYFSGLHLIFLLPEGRDGGVGGRAAKKGGYGCPTVF